MATGGYIFKFTIAESTGGDVDLDGDCLSFPNDIRFISNDLSKDYPFWVESVSGSAGTQTATIWVSMTDSVLSDDYFWIYYSSTEIEASSNGKDTFVFFNDFLDGDLSDFTLSSANGNNWFIQSGATRHDGTIGNVVISGDISDGQWTKMEHTIRSDYGITVNVQNSVSSEGNYDWFRVYVAGSQVIARSGSTGYGLSIANSTSTGDIVISWQYTKDSSVSSGTDNVTVSLIYINKYIATAPPALTSVGTREDTYHGFFEGYTLVLGEGASRKIRLYDFDTGYLRAEADSAVDGYFKINTLNSGTQFLICHDDDGGDSYNDLIYGNLTPTQG